MWGVQCDELYSGRLQFGATAAGSDRWFICSLPVWTLPVSLSVLGLRDEFAFPFRRVFAFPMRGGDIGLCDMAVR